ncbi:sensor histidine kinase [Mediterraneibacter glycyrrhizinilyticus]|uniref:sensor histidine kinase n=1 Tax=Mediterraneibacter glycyrrhizinilyticus TaxID=342942 RepID=UPI00195F59EB
MDFSLFPRNLEWGIWPGALFVTKIILGSLPFLFLKKMIRIRKSRVRTVILLLLCEILMCLLAQKILAGRRQELPGKFWNLLILLSAPVFGMLGALVIFSDQEIVNAWRDISISVLCMLYWVGMVLTVHVLGRQQELERKEYFYQMRQQYYNAMERQQREVRRLRHDMKNHLTALYGLSGEEEKAYLTELLNAPAFSPGRVFCENRTASVVLSAKADQALEQETEFEIHAAIPESIPVDPMDLCALLGNVLDNALETVARMPAEKRKISFSARVEKGLFAAELRNTYLFLEQGADGRPVTLKKDRENHGFGLASAEEIYGEMIDAGNMEYLERFQTDLQQVFGMLQCRGEKQKLQKYIQENRRGDRMLEKENRRLADHGIGFRKSKAGF